MQVLVRRAAAKMLRRIPVDRRTQILQRLKDLAADPNSRTLDVQPLAGGESFRLRVGDYRIIFSLDRPASVLTVDAIRTRGDVYKR
jgi:mRNA interferase RelE/StbE